MRDIRNLRIF